MKELLVLIGGALGWIACHLALLGVFVLALWLRGRLMPPLRYTFRGRLRHVVVHGDTLLGPRVMDEACMPFQAGPPSLRKAGVLWAGAALVTHSLAEEQDQPAILAALAPMGFTPDQFLARTPVLEQVEHSGLRGLAVRDGRGRRAYFLGSPADVLTACSTVWEQQERPLTPDDRLRIDCAQYALATAPLTDDGMGPLCYLGSMHIAPTLADTAPLRRLIRAGIDLTVTPSSAPEVNDTLAALSTAQTIPADAVTIPAVTEDPPEVWVDHLLRRHDRFEVSLSQLRLLTLLQYLLILPAMLAGLSPLTPALPTLALMFALWCTSLPPRAPARSLAKTLLSLFVCLLWPSACALFLRAVAPQAASAAVLCFMLASAGLAGLHLKGWQRFASAGAMAAAVCAALILMQPPAAPVLFALLAAALNAILLRTPIRFFLSAPRVRKCS